MAPPEERDPGIPTSDEPAARLDSRDDRIARALELLVQRESQPPRCRARFRGGKHSLAVTVCYCSVLHDCWVASWPGDRVHHDPEACTIDPAERFGN